MQTKSEKPKVRKKLLQRKADQQGISAFTDNRPEAVMQQKMQESANNKVIQFGGKRSKHNRKNIRLAKTMGYHPSEFSSEVTPREIEHRRVEDQRRDEEGGQFPLFRRGKQKIMLIGTTHGHAGTDHFDQVPEDMRHDTAFVLEYPSLALTGRKTYSSDEVGQVLDNTQASVANYGARNTRSGIALIGADGRKAFGGVGTESVSIRHKVGGTHYNIVKTVRIRDNTLITLGSTFFNASLNISNASIGPVVHGIGQLVNYLDGTNLNFVLTNTYKRVRALSGRLPKSKRNAIKMKALQKLRQDLAGSVRYYNENIEQYTSYGYQNDLIEEVNTNMLGALYDSICNLLLFTEVLGSNKKNVVVAFGADHITPLKELLQDAQRGRNKYRHRRRKKRKRRK